MTRADFEVCLAYETDPAKRQILEWILARTPIEALSLGTVSAPEPEVMPDLDGNVVRHRGVEGLY